MIRTFFFCLLLFTGFNAFAHQYYFGFAEVEYNQMDERLEGTLILSAHDLEDALLKQGTITEKFDRLSHDSLTIRKIGEELFNTFHCYEQGREIRLLPVDFFLTKNGLIEFYFQSETVDLGNGLEIEFTTLMNEFPQQQNKITFIQGTQKQTAVFLQENKRRQLEIY